MKRYCAILGMIGVLAILTASYFYYSPTQEVMRSSTQHGSNTELVKIKTAQGEVLKFDLEVAQTPVDVQVGLMYRESLPEMGGMIFLLGSEPREVAFWMKNTLIPLDMLFVEKDGRIGHIHAMATPESLQSIPSRVPVTSVIEIAGGKAQELGISIGDHVDFRYFQ